MGGCSSTPETPVAKDAAGTSKAIDTQLKQANESESEKVKLLLLGAGESGKSTIFKQFRLMYGAPRTEEDLAFYASAVRNNITVLVKRLLPLVVSLELEGQFAQNERAAYHKILDTISGVTENSSVIDDAAIPVTLQEEIQLLYRSTVWDSVWAQRSTVNAIDAHKLFLDELDVIATPGYVPTKQHIVTARIRTTDPAKEEYDIDGKRFEIYDVGGQRSQRKKWFPLFDDVTAVIFVAALSEYDQKLQEDKRMNCMEEAIGLFKTVVNHDAFKKVPFLLFLNKKDLFEEKLPLSKIQDQKEFADYAGSSYDDATQYFSEKFSKCFESPEHVWKNQFYVHSTDATNTENVKFVWGACRNIITSRNLQESFL